MVTRRAWRVWLGLALGATALAMMLALPVDVWLAALSDWIRSAGMLGAAVYVGVYVVGTVLFAPGSLLTLVAGTVYGPLWGLAIVAPASVLGATAAFLVGRTLARDWVQARVARDPRFQAIDEAVARQGFRIVLLLRLQPIFPFVLLNYALGLTRVRLRDYVLASAAGMLPGASLFVYIGSMVRSVADLAGGDRPSSGLLGLVMLGGGLVALVALLVLLTRMTRRELEKVL